MQHNAFTEEILDQSLRAGGRLVGPVHEFALGDRLARVLVPYLFMVTNIFGMRFILDDFPDGSFYLCRVFHASAVAVLLVNLGCGFLVFLHLSLVSCHLLRPYEGAVFPSCKAPHEGCRKDDSYQEVFDTEELSAIGEEGSKIGLQTIVERYARCKYKEQDSLPDGKLSAFLHAYACDIQGTEEYDHRHDEMVGYHC